MIRHIKEARYLHDYTIWLRFDNGAIGEIDLREELHGEVFEPLKDPVKFKSFRVDPELETIVWDNGADMSPEFLYKKMKVLA